MDILDVVRILILVIVVIFLYFILRYNRAIRFEKRIGRYSTYPIKDDNISLMGKLSGKYNHFASRIEKKYGNDNRINKIRDRYGKYVIVGDDINPIRFIINKLVIAFCFVILLIVSSVMRDRFVGIGEFIVSFVFGYYIYDIYLVVSRKIKIRRIRNDMLRAVIIMNNAFKAGKSIMQAVDIASRELSGPIRLEFVKIYQDMVYGLSSDVVFERFAKRVNIEEARYISSSLTILNKTGGNIVNVFNSIEKTLFDKKKLEEELKNATAASNLVVKVLMFIPFIFILIIYVISPGYFEPFFESALGYFLMIVMGVMFGLFVFVINKIMKVRV